MKCLVPQSYLPPPLLTSRGLWVDTGCSKPRFYNLLAILGFLQDVGALSRVAQILGAPPLPTCPLTFLPMHLFTGFMRKEEQKPLRYITSGMVAMNLCGVERAQAHQALLSRLRDPCPSLPAWLTLGRWRE